MRVSAYFSSENPINNRIVRDLLRRFSDLDLIRVQDVGLIGKQDTVVLAWVAH